MAALHDGLGHQAYVSATGAAAQNAGARLETVGFANDAAPWANEPSIPAGVFEIGGTGRVVGEKALKFRQRPGEREIITRQDIHAQHWI